MSPEDKITLTRMKTLNVRNDIPNDLRIAIESFVQQAVIIGEYELDHMPLEYMENLLKTFARYPEYCETMLEMIKILEEWEIFEK